MSSSRASCSPTSRPVGTEVFVRLARGDASEQMRSATSISVGYMSENYVDLGFPGMLVGVFMIGLVVAAASAISWPSVPWLVCEHRPGVHIRDRSQRRGDLAAQASGRDGHDLHRLCLDGTIRLPDGPELDQDPLRLSVGRGSRDGGPYGAKRRHVLPSEPATAPLNLFYEEPDPDRWLPFRSPSRGAWSGGWCAAPTSRAARCGCFSTCGPASTSSGRRIASTTIATSGPTPTSSPASSASRTFSAKIPIETPILFGTSIYSHPNDDPELPKRRPIRQVLVPSPWVRDMFVEVWPGRVTVWPVGIDTRALAAGADAARDIDVLIYDKIYWQREHHGRNRCSSRCSPSCAGGGCSVEVLRYGSYREQAAPRPTAGASARWSISAGTRPRASPPSR